MPSDLTNASVISKRFSKMRGEFPNWSFDDVSDPNARQKLINIANRFLTLTMRHPSWIFLFFGGRIVTFAPV